MNRMIALYLSRILAYMISRMIKHYIVLIAAHIMMRMINLYVSYSSPCNEGIDRHYMVCKV
jgi:hypothetical protein